jgi:ABC-type sugar transport system permease subunit
MTAIALQEKQKTAPRSPKKKRGLSRRGHEILFVCLVLFLPLLQFVLFWLVPNFDSIIMGFQKLDGEGNLYFTAQNFVDFWKNLQDIESGLTYAIVNTLIFFVVTTLFNTPFVLFLSYGLYKKVPGYKIFRVIFYIPAILGGTVTANLFRYMVNTGGPLETLLVKMGLPVNTQIGLLSDPKTAFLMVLLYSLWMAVGSNFILFTGAMQRIPNEIMEASEVDGAGFWRQFVQVVIPLIWPTITTLFVFGLAGLFCSYGAVMLLTPRVKEATMVGWYINSLTIDTANGGGGNLYYPAAVGLVFTLIGLPIVLLSKRFLEHFSKGVEY